MVCAFAKTENPASDLVLERMLGGKKYFFLRNEANKSYEINRKVVRQGETKPLNAKSEAVNWSQKTDPPTPRLRRACPPEQ